MGPGRDRTVDPARRRVTSTSASTARTAPSTGTRSSSSPWNPCRPPASAESPITEVDVAPHRPDARHPRPEHRRSARSDLNVGWSNPGGDTGVTMAKHYQYADHVAFDQAIGEFIDRDDIGDVSVEITPNTRTFALHVPRKGTDRTGTRDAHVRWQCRRLPVRRRRRRHHHPRHRPRPRRRTRPRRRRICRRHRRRRPHPPRHPDRAREDDHQQSAADRDRRRRPPRPRRTGHRSRRPPHRQPHPHPRDRRHRLAHDRRRVGERSPRPTSGSSAGISTAPPTSSPSPSTRNEMPMPRPAQIPDLERQLRQPHRPRRNPRTETARSHARPEDDDRRRYRIPTAKAAPTRLGDSATTTSTPPATSVRPEAARRPSDRRIDQRRRDYRHRRLRLDDPSTADRPVTTGIRYNWPPSTRRTASVGPGRASGTSPKSRPAPHRRATPIHRRRTPSGLAGDVTASRHSRRRSSRQLGPSTTLDCGPSAHAPRGRLRPASTSTGRLARTVLDPVATSASDGDGHEWSTTNVSVDC